MSRNYPGTSEQQVVHALKGQSKKEGRGGWVKIKDGNSSVQRLEAETVTGFYRFGRSKFPIVCWNTALQGVHGVASVFLNGGCLGPIAAGSEIRFAPVNFKYFTSFLATKGLHWGF